LCAVFSPSRILLPEVLISADLLSGKRAEPARLLVWRHARSGHGNFVWPALKK